MDFIPYKNIFIGAGLTNATLSTFFDNGIFYDQRSHVGGNCHTEYDEKSKAHIHKYGAHIFHTDNKEVWEFVNKYSDFNDYQHRVGAKILTGEVLPLPVGKSTLKLLYGQEKTEDINNTHTTHTNKYSHLKDSTNLEDYCLYKYGFLVYDRFIRYYTEKQWGINPRNLPKEIVQRLPFSTSEDLPYFRNATYQGLPVDGYTKMIDNMIGDRYVRFGKKMNISDLMVMLTDSSVPYRVFYSGALDELFNYKFGELGYRSIEFTFQRDNEDLNHGYPVLNFTSNRETRYTRCVNHNALTPNSSKEHYVHSYELSVPHSKNNEPMYPINNAENNERYNQYLDLLIETFGDMVIPVGRLATYSYMDMDKCIEQAFKFVKMTTKEWFNYIKKN